LKLAVVMSPACGATSCVKSMTPEIDWGLQLPPVAVPLPPVVPIAPELPQAASSATDSNPTEARRTIEASREVRMRGTLAPGELSVISSRACPRMRPTGQPRLSGDTKRP